MADEKQLIKDLAALTGHDPAVLERALKNSKSDEAAWDERKKLLLAKREAYVQTIAEIDALLKAGPEKRPALQHRSDFLGANDGTTVK